ncbi:sr-related ctd associated factor 6 [Holotrichia oblita]|uniref:Sr-related ctd associated factor 6 n=1 Tax=Holotrichia oblita TaxID=644536 RepID=A0ACB9T5G0_HOLOL|nr:sr-related ctd associated factor 6 [Holotrichia oblita]
MDLPQPPQDTELRNIIDKLAQFVARNGPEFEQMTKNKQKGNPKFQFLYGGEFYTYYQYKVSAEQSQLKQDMMQSSQPPQQNSWIPPTPNNNTLNSDIEQLNQQIETLQEQIKQSEQNLQAQHAVLLQQQQVQMETIIFDKESAELRNDADECGIVLEELDQILQPIIDSCTKDSIQAGKSWILQHVTNKSQAFVIARYLLQKAMEPGASFPRRLHVIYLVNDVLHHCARKSATDLKNALESVAVAMFCGAAGCASDEQRLKLDKLLQLWESKANYLAPATVDALRKPQESLQQYVTQQINKYGGICESFFPPPGIFPDFSKPPPGFPVVQEAAVPEELMPTVPYYELPAGLMVPLIKLEDTAFKSLDPSLIRLPPPAPPSERLLAAVEAFYAPPSHERPRDSEGWEKLGLYEYYKAKNAAKKEKEEQINAGIREKSRSPSPIHMVVEKSPSPPKRRYTSRSPTPPRRSRSRSPKRRRSKSSRSKRTRSRSPKSRSPSPLVSTPIVIAPLPIQEQLDPSNKGHQMLKRMGWGGSGLGAHEQGIDAPISGGDVRDRQDQFKGVGCSLNDPYENFRKNKGAAFITRMKARAEERAQESM